MTAPLMPPCPVTPGLESVFAGTRPVYVSDDDALVGWLAGLGLPAQGWADARHQRHAAVVLIATAEWDAPGDDRRDIQEEFAPAQVLWVPLSSFDASFEAATYTLSLLLASDPGRAVGRNRTWTDLYSNYEGPFRFTGPGTDITCELRESLILATRLPLRLSGGEWDSIGNYFEVNIEYDQHERYRDRTGGEAFLADGHLAVEGLAAARHRRMAPGEMPMFDAGAELVAEVGASGKPVVLELEDAFLRACWVGDDDLSGTIQELTNPRYDGRCLEYAVGTNHEIKPYVDWSLNSQLNEGVGGLHFGIGDGMTGVHMDFISSTAALTSHEVDLDEDAQ